MDNLGFCRGFLVTFTLYVVLGAGRTQFGILAGFYIAYLNLCIPSKTVSFHERDDRRKKGLLVQGVFD